MLYDTHRKRLGNPVKKAFWFAVTFILVWMFVLLFLLWISRLISPIFKYTCCKVRNYKLDTSTNFPDDWMQHYQKQNRDDQKKISRQICLLYVFSLCSKKIQRTMIYLVEFKRSEEIVEEVHKKVHNIYP